MERQQDEVLDDMSAALSRLGDVSNTINVELNSQVCVCVCVCVCACVWC